MEHQRYLPQQYRLQLNLLSFKGVILARYLTYSFLSICNLENGPQSASSLNAYTAAGYWPVIAHRDRVPTWLRDNDSILTGRPIPISSY